MKPNLQPDPDGMTGDPYKDSGKNYKLKVAPKICEVCGQKYIPTGKGQKYCQACKSSMNHKELHARRLAKAKEQAFGPGPWSMPAISEDIGCGGAGGDPAGLPPKQWDPEPEDVAEETVEEPAAVIEAQQAEERGFYMATVKKDGEVVLEAKIRDDMLQMIMEVVR